MAKFNYAQIQGVQGNANVTPEFIATIEQMAGRLQTKSEYLLAAMSFETGGRFDPALRNGIGATGLIQFLKGTAKNLGTTTDKLAKMTAVAQLAYVEKYLKPFAGKLTTLEAVYTSILFGSPKKPDAILFKAGTPAYKLNPLDWNKDGIITAREATTIVAARMFGGVRAVQQKLLEAGVMPAAKTVGFVDGNWGTDTSDALAVFQKKNGLDPTGLMDEATGEALFATGPTTTPTPVPTDPAVPAPISLVLEKGTQSDAVGLLQDALVKLGYLTLDQISNARGTFGPKTEAAVKALQQHLGLTATGQVGDVEQKAIADILQGVRQGDPNMQVVKAIQTRLAAVGTMTQQQVDTGFGTFGGQTEGAVKQFQTDNKLPASGVVEAETFKALFNQVASDTPTTAGVFTAHDGQHFTVVGEILMTESLQTKVANLANHYFALTGQGLIVTSGYRPPDRQARAMYQKLTVDGETKVRNLYRNKAAIDEILNVYRQNKGNPTIAIAALQKTIENQVKRGVLISNHLRADAVDIRKPTTNLALLRTAATQTGGPVVIEGDHYHVELH
jgi:peptidoglycan hydrolase-like protein with peptidoglycan-binding domain